MSLWEIPDDAISFLREGNTSTVEQQHNANATEDVNATEDALQTQPQAPDPTPVAPEQPTAPDDAVSPTPIPSTPIHDVGDKDVEEAPADEGLEMRPGFAPDETDAAPGRGGDDREADNSTAPPPPKATPPKAGLCEAPTMQGRLSTGDRAVSAHMVDLARHQG